MPDRPRRTKRRKGYDHRPDPQPRPAPHPAGAALLADCDYCGSRSVVRFEPGRLLACPGCGARLRPLQQTAPAQPPGISRARAAHPVERPRTAPPKVGRKHKKKKRKLQIGEILEEAWEAIEDLFD